MIEEEELRTHLRAIRRSGHWEALLDLILTHTGECKKKISMKLYRGTPLVPDDYPALQLEQGKIQGLQKFYDDLVDYALEENEAPQPKTRDMDV